MTRAVAVWIGSTAFTPETMGEETVLDELGIRERRMHATVSPAQRDHLLELARSKAEPLFEGEEP